MADPYFNPHTLYADFQNAYKSVMSRCNLVLNDCPQQIGVAFGLQVQQTAPSTQLNSSILNGENVHNPFNHSRFKQVPVRVIYHQDSTLNGTAGNSYSGVGQSTPQSSLVVDSNLHHSGEISNQGRIDTVSHPMPQVAFDKPQEDKMLQDQIDSVAHATGSESERTYFQDYYKKNKDTLRAKQLHRNSSDNQSTSSEEIIDDNTPFFDRERERYHEKVQDPEKRKLRNQRERERRADPEKRKLRNQRKRERYHEKVQDPEKRKLINQRQRERRADPEKRKLRNQREKERLAAPEKRKLINQRQRERYHEKVQDPEKRKLINQRERERLADPEKRKLKNQRQRERLADPEKRKLRNQRQRERYHEKMQDPEKRKLRNQRQRERRADPEKRKLINQRQRERLADPEKRKLRNQRQRERRADPEKRKLRNQRQRERYHEKVQDPEKRKLRNQRQQALPAISPSGDISQLSYITEATPTSSTN